MRKISGISILFITFALVMTACGKKEETRKIEKSDIQMVPFQFVDGGKWGYMDFEGNVKIDTMFVNTPSYFREGFAVIKKKNDNYDFIDTEGKAKGKDYVAATMFSDGLAAVVDKDNPPKFIDKNFKTVFNLNDAIVAGMFSEGLARFANNDEKWGFVDKKGNVAIKPKYNSVTDFSEGLAVVVIRDSTNNKVGFIDKTGKEVIPLSDSIKMYRPFKEGLAAYTKGKGWGFIDKEGNIVIPAEADRSEVTDFYEGNASFKEGGEWGLFDKKGTKVILPKYSNPIRFYNGLAVYECDNKFGFMDRDENTVIKPQYKDIGLPFLDKNAFVLIGAHFYIIDMKGDIINKQDIKSINSYFISAKSAGQTVLSNVPEVVEKIKARTDSLKALQKAQSNDADLMQQQKLDQLKQLDDAVKQRQQQLAMMQQQPKINMSGTEMAKKLADLTEKIISENKGDMQKLAQALASLEMETNMVIQQKQNDKKFMQEFQAEMQRSYAPLQQKYKDVFMQLQKYLIKMQEEQLKKQKEMLNNNNGDSNGGK